MIGFSSIFIVMIFTSFDKRRTYSIACANHKHQDRMKKKEVGQNRHENNNKNTSHNNLQISSFNVVCLSQTKRTHPQKIKTNLFKFVRYDIVG